MLGMKGRAPRAWEMLTWRQFRCSGSNCIRLTARPVGIRRPGSVSSRRYRSEEGRFGIRRRRTSHSGGELCWNFLRPNKGVDKDWMSKGERVTRLFLSLLREGLGTCRKEEEKNLKAKSELLDEYKKLR